MTELMIPMTLFLSTAAVLIVWLTLRHRERILMVEKGLSAAEIKAIYSRNTRRDPLSSLKWGILFVFGGAATVFAGVMHDYMNIDEGAAIVGMVSIFIGAGLLLFYRLASKKIGQEGQTAGG